VIYFEGLFEKAHDFRNFEVVQAVHFPDQCSQFHFTNQMHNTKCT